MKKAAISCLVLTLFLFIGCRTSSPTPASKESGIIPGRVERKAIGQEGWQVEWEKTLRAAQKEGRVIVYGGSTAAALKTHASRLIKEKYGFDLEILTGRDNEILARIRSERNSGLSVPDLFASGPRSVYGQLKPWGAVEPIEPALLLPEVLDPKLWFGGKLPWGDEARKVFIWAGYPLHQIAINSTMVQPGEIKSFYDLLQPKWKGKIVANDVTEGSGAGFTGFTILLYNKVVEPEFFRQLVGQRQMTMLRDQHLQIIWLAVGKFPLALWPSPGRMGEYKAQGAPLEWLITKEGVNLGGGGAAVALMNKASHPNAARIFLNWLFSKEGQLLLQNSTEKQSLRIDISTDKFDPSQIRQPGIKYLPDPSLIEKWVLEEQDKYLDLAKEIFAPLLK